MNARSKSILKYIIALVLLWLILRHAETGKIESYLVQMSAWQMLLAMVLTTFAQIICAMRMRFFFLASGFPLSRLFAFVLYYIGAFYNFLLPGGIGGDAYKVILARQRMDMPAMQGIRLMLADRASGLCVLMLMLFAGMWKIGFPIVAPYEGVLALSACMITLAAYVFFCRLLLKQSVKTMLASLPYSLAGQLMWVLTLAVLWLALGHGEHLLEYAVLYCVASISGMLPISVGGLGIKEMAYYYGALFIARFAGISVDPELGIALSLCLFAMGFISALPGLLYLEKVKHLPHH